MKRRKEGGEDGFEAWGGYMNAKISKLEQQFQLEAEGLDDSKKQSDLFKGVAIFVNGHSEPPAEVLRSLMLRHGGVFHDYQVPATTHVIASNLPNAKLQQEAFGRVLKPEWIVDSIAAGKLLPIGPYLLCARSALQPTLNFQTVDDGGKKPAKTAVDSSFISEFYNNSRLHHLSTMGAMLKQYVGKLKDNHKGVYPGLEKLKNVPSSHKEMPVNEKIIMHIDMDCFFVSVALRERPELRGKPVAVTHARGNLSHARPGADPAKELAMYQARSGVPQERISSKSGKSTDGKESRSEVASCSYEARALGVRNGMYLGRALALCPGLITVPYNFAAYTEVSYALYDTVAEYTLAVEAVSCDELFVDCTSALRAAGVSAEVFTKSLRVDVKERTGCPCSAGLGANKLQARLASKKAKPDGQYHIAPEDIQAFMRDVSVKDLPGVGWSTTRKLQQMDVETCMDLQTLSLTTLKTQLGDKTGEMLHRFCRGIDERAVVSEHIRKSVSAEVNYGIRFTTKTEAEDFLRRLSSEVADRLAGLNLRGRCITLKLLTRSADAPVETAKFLGHGVCDAASRSIMLSASTSESNIIADNVFKLYTQMAVVPEDMRGVGIQVTKLDGMSRPGTLQSFLSKPGKKIQKQEKQVVQKEVATSSTTVGTPALPLIAELELDGMSRPGTLQSFLSKPGKKIQQVVQKEVATSSSVTENPALPPIAELDPDVLSALPDDIRNELLAQYGAVDFPKCVQKPAKVGHNLFENLPANELRALIETWVETEQTPEDYDVSLLVEHCVTQVTAKQIDLLDTTLRCLWRCIRKNRAEVAEWRAVYQTVVSRVQDVMVQIYKYPLRIATL